MVQSTTSCRILPLHNTNYALRSLDRSKRLPLDRIPSGAEIPTFSPDMGFSRTWRRHIIFLATAHSSPEATSHHERLRCSPYMLSLELAPIIGLPAG